MQRPGVGGDAAARIAERERVLADREADVARRAAELRALQTRVDARQAKKLETAARRAAASAAKAHVKAVTIAQRRGFRAVFLIAMALWVVASGVFALAETQLPIALAFSAIAVANGGFNIASNNMVFEFTGGELRPRFIATSSTIGDVAATASALAGGYLAEVAPLPALFLLACGFCASAGVVMWRGVVEPRTPARDEALRRDVQHYFHPVGTAAMGTDARTSVCDPQGRVHGVDGLIVADVSSMPRIPRANTNIPAVVVGERIVSWLV